ncbi:MAG: hypothetical protein L3I99_03595 [Sulfurimonas sp.]|nr:hypothetical protein [Sulfurimonas sp.]
MKKLGLGLLFIAIMVGVTGCGKNTPTVAEKKVTKKFQFSNAKLNLTQAIETEIEYHTQKELEIILNGKLTKLLEDNKILSENTQMNTLVINVNYQRRFVGDETSMPSDSLRYPKYSYSIEIIDTNKSINTINKNNLAFKGGLKMNLKVIAGTLRDKKYELEFIDALANTIVEDIKNLN